MNPARHGTAWHGQRSGAALGAGGADTATCTELTTAAPQDVVHCAAGNHPSCARNPLTLLQAGRWASPVEPTPTPPHTHQQATLAAQQVAVERDRHSRCACEPLPHVLLLILCALLLAYEAHQAGGTDQVGQDGHTADGKAHSSSLAGGERQREGQQ